MALADSVGLVVMHLSEALATKHLERGSVSWCRIYDRITKTRDGRQHEFAPTSAANPERWTDIPSGGHQLRRVAPGTAGFGPVV